MAMMEPKVRGGMGDAGRGQGQWATVEHAAALRQGACAKCLQAAGARPRTAARDVGWAVDGCLPRQGGGAGGHQAAGHQGARAGGEAQLPRRTCCLAAPQLSCTGCRRFVRVPWLAARRAASGAFQALLSAC